MGKTTRIMEVQKITNATIDDFKKKIDILLEIYRKEEKELDLQLILETEKICNFDKAPIVIYGARYGEDIFYTAKFLFNNHLIGNICPSSITTFEEVIAYVVARIKKSYYNISGINAARDIIVIPDIYDSEEDISVCVNNAKICTIKLDTELTNITFNKITLKNNS